MIRLPIIPTSALVECPGLCLNNASDLWSLLLCSAKSWGICLQPSLGLARKVAALDPLTQGCTSTRQEKGSNQVQQLHSWRNIKSWDYEVKLLLFYHKGPRILPYLPVCDNHCSPHHYKNHCRAQAAMNYRELVATTLICGDPLETSCPARPKRVHRCCWATLNMGIDFAFDIIDKYEEKKHAAAL